MGHYGSGMFNHSIRGGSCSNHKVVNEINVSIDCCYYTCALLFWKKLAGIVVPIKHDSETNH